MLIDVSHTVEHGMITYKGLPAPVISDFMSREDSRSHYDAGTEQIVTTFPTQKRLGHHVRSGKLDMA